MDAEKWKGILRKAFPKDRAVKALVLLGLCGIGLIFLSSLSGGKGKAETDPTEEAASAGPDRYKEELERDLCRIVRAITGEESPAVLVTLKDGGRQEYAEDSSSSSRRGEDESLEELEKTHVLLKDSGGGQQALTVAEIQPEVKGVVVVSRYAADPAVREKLTQAVRTALDVSSARVCVTDTG